jgi:hypothetical protein
VAIFFITACSSGPKNSGPDLVNTWAYTPHVLQIHPLSRYGDDKIIVHVAFQDGDGFECRGVGSLVLTITGSTTKDAVKTINLSDDAINRDHFDGLTRTYLMHFNATPADLHRVRVSAVFTPQVGNKLRASGTIEK